MNKKYAKSDNCGTCRFCEIVEDIGQAECRHSPPSIKGNDDAECALYPMVGVELNMGWDFQFKCSFYSANVRDQRLPLASGMGDDASFSQQPTK